MSLKIFPTTKFQMVTWKRTFLVLFHFETSVEQFLRSKDWRRCAAQTPTMWSSCSKSQSLHLHHLKNCSFPSYPPNSHKVAHLNSFLQALSSHNPRQAHHSRVFRLLFSNLKSISKPHPRLAQLLKSGVLHNITVFVFSTVSRHW